MKRRESHDFVVGGLNGPGRCSLLMLAVVLAATSAASAQSSNVVISQIYGGGGGSAGAPTYDQDYVELYNRGTSVVDLSGWSVQYAGSTSSTWSKMDLAGEILPGQYVLVGGAMGTVGNALPVSVDVSGAIDLDASAGKVALVSNQNALPSQPCFDQGFSGVVDLVGYGQGVGGANCAEGVPAQGLSETLAAIRLLDGCQDKNNNSVDFSAGTPLPRNSSSMFTTCAPFGACCTGGNTKTCSISTQADCAGTYLGDYSVCGAVIYLISSTAGRPLIDISATGTPGPAQGHNVLSEVIDLPFSFKFYDLQRTQFRYSTNGWLTFNLAETDSAPNNPSTLPAPASPNLTIAPLWDEFVSDTSGPNQIYLQTIGEAPNRQFIIQYNNVLKYNTSDRYTFQVLLYEGPDEFGYLNRIEYRYSQFVAQAAGDAVVGLESLAGQLGRVRLLSQITVGAANWIATSDNGRCQLGACCLGTDCLTTNSASCQFFGGGPINIQTTCAVSPCSSGACCLNDGGCQSLSPFACANQGGVYRGDDSDCQGPCPPTGSCCPADGSGNCTLKLQATCESAGGTWGGAGSSCSQNPCVGACCMLDGSCQEIGPTPCAAQGGPFYGVGVSCEFVNNCPPAGACCASQHFADCTLLTEAACLQGNGYWQGVGSTCSPENDCTGVCCVPDGTCHRVPPADCIVLGGTFRGRGTDCATIQPPCDPGERCCLPFETCMDLTVARCIQWGGTPAGPGTRCGQVDFNVSQIDPNFTDISQTGTRVINANQDDVDADFFIGFPFTFYTECGPRSAGRVGSNGLMVFTGLAQSHANSPIPFGDLPNNAIYPFWDDLVISSVGGVYVQTIGSAPNRVCIVEWKDVDLVSSPDPNDHMTFECKLFEGTNCIEFHYQHLRSPRSATIGVENPAGTGGSIVFDSQIGNGPSAVRLCPPQPGACCLSDGSCISATLFACINVGGDFHGEGSDCSGAGCQPYGACCTGNPPLNCSLKSFGTCLAIGGSWSGAGTNCSNSPCNQITATLDGYGTGCPGQERTLLVTLSGGTPPYTVTLDNGAGTQTGNSPMYFQVYPVATTTYSIVSASDSLNQSANLSGNATLEVPTSPDCNGNGVWDDCELIDMNVLIDALLGVGNSPDQCLADVNHDGFVDGRDVLFYVYLVTE